MSPTAWPIPHRSRDRVLSALRDAAGPVGVAEVVKATGLSANSVRFHLQRLMDTGQVLVAAERARAGRGRPAIRYAPAALAPADPSAPYRVLAALLTRAVEQSEATGAATDAGRYWARSMAAELAAVREPVAAVREAFAKAGFDARTGPGRRTLELHSCPFLELAVRSPDVVCGVHRGLVAGLLEEIGAPFEVELVPVLDGPGPCLVHLTATSGTSRRTPMSAATEEHAP